MDPKIVRFFPKFCMEKFPTRLLNLLFFIVNFVPSVLNEESEVKSKNIITFLFHFFLGPILGEWCTPSMGAVILKRE